VIIKQITGKSGQAYVVNGIKFDGINSSGRLIEVKGDYSTFIDSSTGKFKSWFTGIKGLIDQSQRQVEAAGGSAIDWYFSNIESMNAIKTIFVGKVQGINFIYQAIK
jgi:filamentous hemagglutinin